ncbi:hypothetical protein OAU50_02965 [Planctomycetota bacterium]|nr:hypothetical protein [Planctomycetota bacterium]
MARISKRGAALMLVMVMLFLLVAVAVSFVFLMSQQEGTSVVTLESEQTRIVSRTGADHAYAMLHPRNRLNEFARWDVTAPADVNAYVDPYFDSYTEGMVDLQVDFEGNTSFPPIHPGLSGFKVEDPNDLVMGMNIEDESGKVNLNACNFFMIANLIGASTVQGEVSNTGGGYDQIVLEDASFLTPYDENSIPGDSTFGGGYVVIDGQLLEYASRRGNVLMNVTPNPQYPGMNGNAIFRSRSEGHVIKNGEFVTTPTAWKILYYRLITTQNGKPVAKKGMPRMFNSTGDVRRISEMPRFTNAANDGLYGPYIDGFKMPGWPEGLPPVVYQQLQRTATVFAPTPRFDGTWHYPHSVLATQMEPEGESGLNFCRVFYERTAAVQPSFYAQWDPRSPYKNRQDDRFSGISAGNIVRLRRPSHGAMDPEQFHMGIVLRGFRNPNRSMVDIVTLSDVEIELNSGEPWIIEVLENAPININTASDDVLAAVFHGIGQRRQDVGPISKTNAYVIANQILRRTRDKDDSTDFTSIDDLQTFLSAIAADDGPLTQSQLNFFIQSQRFPYASSQGRFTVNTAVFSYSSMDTWAVDSYATKYLRSGGVVARHGFREWVQIGSDQTRTWKWDTFQQLENEMKVPQGNIFNLFASGQTNGRTMGVLELPYIHYQTDERYMRQRFARPWSQRTPRNITTMADNSNRPENFYTNITTSQYGGHQVGDLDAGMFSFWYRPRWGGDLQTYKQRKYIFDVAEQENSNRMSMLWWGENRTRAGRFSQNIPTLVFRIKDRTLDEAYTELHYDLDDRYFRNREWYHFNMNWKGTQLSHLHLLVDGDSRVSGGRADPVGIAPRVDHTFKRGGAVWEPRTSILQSDLPAPGGTPALTLEFDSADQPNFQTYTNGVIMIGDEAIEFTNVLGYEFQNIRRGARGTTQKYHPEGSRITVFGYVSPLRSYQVNANGVNQPNFPNLPITTGRTNSQMGTNGIYRVVKVGTDDSNYYKSTELGPDAGFAGGGDDTRGGNPNLLPLGDYTGLQERGIVAVYGFGFRGYHPPGSPGVPPAVLPAEAFPDIDPATAGVESTIRVPDDLKFEYVAYDGITANGLNVLARYDENFDRKDPADWFHFFSSYTDLVQPQDPNNQTNVNQINFFAAGTCVIPVSIDMDDVSGYHPKSVVGIDDEYFFYNNIWDMNVVGDITDQPGINDHLFPTLYYIDSGRTKAYVNQHAASGTVNPTAMNRHRRYLSTGVTGHNLGTPVVPGFAARVTVGENDRVTLVNNKNSDKELHRIRRHRLIYDGGDGVVGNMNDVYITTLHAHTQHAYNPNNTSNPYNAGNILKFPTGELPVELPVEWSFAGKDPRVNNPTSHASNNADFDSFEFRQYNKGNFQLLDDLMDTLPGEGGEIRVNIPLPPNMSVIKVDDELIAYRGFETRTIQIPDPNNPGSVITITAHYITDITRGILGTIPEAHSGGTYIMNMASLRVGYPFQSTINPHEHILNAVWGAETFRPYGFVRISEGNQTEVAGYQKYTSRTQNVNGVQTNIGTITTGSYDDDMFPQGLFRGVYGTRAHAFSDRALLFDQPIRFPDWFPGFSLDVDRGHRRWHTPDAEVSIPGLDSPELSSIQGSASFRNSNFKEFKWRVSYAPHADTNMHQDYLGARLVMRFRAEGKPTPGWEEFPTNRPGGLYAFDFDPSGSNSEDLGQTLYEQTQDLTIGSPGGIRADGIEWRVYFYFKQNAFEHDRYKATLQFHGAEMSLEQLTKVLRHEEKR